MNSPIPPKNEHGAPPTGLLPAFLARLVETLPRLRVDINIEQTSFDGIEFSFALANPVLHGWLADDGELVVSVDWVGENWDLLLDLEVSASETVGGFLCSTCESEGKHRVFPTIEALWRDHLFDPFEEWINTRLADAYAVALYQTDNRRGGTWARFVRRGEDVASSAFLIVL